MAAIAQLTIATAVAMVGVLVILPVVCEGKRAPKAEPVAPHAKNPSVPQTTLANFRERILDPTVPVVLAIYDPSEAKVTETIEASVDHVAEALDKLVQCTYMDGTSEDGAQIVKMFGVSRLPAIILFNPELVPIQGQEGQYMKHPLGYEGDGSKTSLLKFVLGSLSMFHLELVSDDHDLADFFTKYSIAEMPHFLYFTEQSHISPLYTAVAQRFRYGAVFGVVLSPNSSRSDGHHGSTGMEVHRRYGVTTFPSLLALIPSVESASDEVIRMTTLTKQSTLDDLTAFVAEHAMPDEKQQHYRQHIYMEEEKLRVKEKEHAKMVHALPPIVARTKKDWVRECLTRKKGLCYAVFLESIDDEGRLPIEMLFNVSRKIAVKSNLPVQIVIVDGLYNHEIVSHFGMTSGLPDAVVLNPSKKKARTFMNLIGSFTERGLTNFFLEKCTKGIGAKPYKAKQVPKFVKTPRKLDEDEISDEL